MEGPHPSLILALALAAGVLAQTLARHVRVPGIVLLLAVGAILGPDGLGWVEPRSLATGLFGVVEFAVAVILFEGGLNLELPRLRREQTPIRRLVTLGPLVTLAGASVAVHGLLGWSWAQAVIFGSLVVVTGPTVVTPLLRELRLRARVSTVLEAEGVLIDPIGAILAVLVLQLVLAPEAEGVASGALGLLLRLGFGTAGGVAAGFLMAAVLRGRRIVPEGFENIFTLAAVLLLYHGWEVLVSSSGILAVTVAGVVVGNVRTRVDRDLREFKDQLTVLLVGLLFILLAADVRLADVRALGWIGAAVVAALVLVVRPLNVAIATAGSELTRGERVFIAWLAPRGIVAAAIAALTAGAMERRGIPGGAEIRALVFLTIAGTVLLAGFTAGPVASLLGLRLPKRETVAILGARGLGLVLGEELRRAGVPVLFLDSNPHHCRRAEEAGFQVVFGNALEERTLQRARFEQVGAAVGLTSNETLNCLFVGQARDAFSVPEGYVSLTNEEAGMTLDLVRQREARVLFEAVHDTDRWDVRSRHGEIEVVQLTYRGGPKDEEEPSGTAERSEPFVFLTVQREDRVSPMSVAFEPREGDVASVALYQPDREVALRTLSKLHWERA